MALGVLPVLSAEGLLHRAWDDVLELLVPAVALLAVVGWRVALSVPVLAVAAVACRPRRGMYGWIGPRRGERRRGSHRLEAGVRPVRRQPSRRPAP